MTFWRTMAEIQSQYSCCYKQLFQQKQNSPLYPFLTLYTLHHTVIFIQSFLYTKHRGFVIFANVISSLIVCDLMCFIRDLVYTVHFDEENH